MCRIVQEKGWEEEFSYYLKIRGKVISFPFIKIESRGECESKVKE
jgi:hypothetical protein